MDSKRKYETENPFMKKGQVIIVAEDCKCGEDIQFIKVATKDGRYNEFEYGIPFNIIQISNEDGNNGIVVNGVLYQGEIVYEDNITYVTYLGSNYTKFSTTLLINSVVGDDSIMYRIVEAFDDGFCKGFRYLVEGTVVYTVILCREELID